MKLLSRLLKKEVDVHGVCSLWFRCPGCVYSHAVTVERPPGAPAGPTWGWNANAERPTFTPSILVRTVRGQGLTDADWEEYDRIVRQPGGTDAVLNHPKFGWTCHSFVTDGRIQFLSDCSHHLAGQTVDLPAWSEAEPA